MKKYFIAKGDKQESPYLLDELLDIGIQPTTLIWSDDFEDWIVKRKTFFNPSIRITS